MDSEPVAYGYVYRDYAGRRVIHYGGSGGEINGSKPVDVIPLYTRPTPTDAAPDGLVVRVRNVAMGHVFNMDVIQEIARQAAARITADTAKIADLEAAKWQARHTDTANTLVQQGMALEAAEAKNAEQAATIARLSTPTIRKQFPILGGGGAKIDWQLVVDHGRQAKANHYQTVERLAERGGLSWCELHAVLHNRPWQKMDENTAIVECRSLEASYLAALSRDGEAG